MQRTQPRSSLVSIDDTPSYHWVCRSMRRAYLCGEDHWSGKNFDHRRGWIADRVKQFAGVFAVDITAYAVMSNHYHLILRIDRERTSRWSIEEVLKRWTSLFSPNFLASKYLSKARSEMRDAEIAEVLNMAEMYRVRLCDLSWFMRSLNEKVARMANRDDGVKGRFWEGRFKSQALLDNKALVAAMTYVDLNPVRAGLAATPEAPDFTSVKERIEGLAPRSESGGDSEETVANVNSATAGLDDEIPEAESKVRSLPKANFMPFDAAGRAAWSIPFGFDDYLDLVDWTGRAVHPGKRGVVPAQQPKLLTQFGIDGDRFIENADRLLKAFGTAVGAPESLVSLCG